MQMLTLAYSIPFIIRDIVETDCPYFSNFKKLLEITTIVSEYSISSEMIQYLADSIAEYLNNYANLYGSDDENAKFVPKQQSKRRVQGMRNYKNLPFTLAVRHQYWQTLQLLGPLEESVITGPTKLEATETLQFYALFPEEALQCTTKWANFNGVKYICDKCLIAVGYQNDTCLPQFAALPKF